MLMVSLTVWLELRLSRALEKLSERALLVSGVFFFDAASTCSLVSGALALPPSMELSWSVSLVVRVEVSASLTRLLVLGLLLTLPRKELAREEILSDPPSWPTRLVAEPIIELIELLALVAPLSVELAELVELLGVVELSDLQPVTEKVRKPATARQKRRLRLIVSSFPKWDMCCREHAFPVVIRENYFFMT